MSTTTSEYALRLDASVRRLDERLARAAVAWSLDPHSAVDEAADQLLAMADGNRVAVERALRRVDGGRPTARQTPSGRAGAILRLTLARGDWAW
jgi:hypothetical protein